MNNKIKKALHLFLLALLFVFPSACENGGTEQPDASPVITPLVRPKGVSNGMAVGRNIGPEGGSLQSVNGRFRINVPQGALASNTMITIEPVSNTNIAGIGAAFRLTPHGQIFSKPVTITYSWAGYADSVGLLQTLGLAYQMADGVWNFVGADSFDSGAKTVSFKTTHFSDWSLMNRISLSPYRASLETGQKLAIKAMTFTDAHPDNLFVPLVNDPNGPYNEPGYPVGEPAPLPSRFIKSWELNGPGDLTRSSGQVVEYRAPASVNGAEEATVTVELNAPVPGTYLLVSNISIMGDGWIELSMNGGAPVRFPASPVVKMGSRYLLANPEDEGGGHFLLTWNGELGSHGYDLSTSGTSFHFLTPGISYVSMYLPHPDSPVMPSGGSVNVTKLSDGIAEGTFTVTKVGVNSELKPLASASGRFKAKLFIPKDQ
ncbi:hypothetical protein GCM10023091_31090 [Ravibacter arvi]|uniref:ZU5 domain-containing protein n=1 Tax=Ravibacter arvi TaxID=2051041 RepID=A0ABP8M4D8_9BACT